VKLGNHGNRRKRDPQQVRAALMASVRWIGKLLIGAALIPALAVGVWSGGHWLFDWAHRSPSFALKRVAFVGLRHASEDELCRVAGIRAGQNIFQLDPEALGRAIGTHPYIREAAVSRSLPSSLSVRVRERRPIAVVSLAELYLVDEQGEPFKRVENTDPLDLPLLTGVTREQYVESPQSSSARFRRALEVAEVFARDQPRDSRLSEIRIERGGTTLVTEGGLEIRMGEGEIGEKLARLKRVKLELARLGLGAQSIRLENRARPGWVAVKLNGPAEKARLAK